MLDASGEVCSILAFLQTSFDRVLLACRAVVYLPLGRRQIIDFAHQRPAAHHLKADSQPSTRPQLVAYADEIREIALFAAILKPRRCCERRPRVVSHTQKASPSRLSYFIAIG